MEFNCWEWINTNKFIRIPKNFRQAENFRILSESHVNPNELFLNQRIRINLAFFFKPRLASHKASIWRS